MSDLGWTSYKRLAKRAGNFPPEAFEFVREGLAHTAKIVHGDAENPVAEEQRHVSGQQLCLGLRDFAIKRYGRLARAVLHRWNIRKTDDFGRIVFAMIDEGILRKTPDDSLEDFANVFDFDEAFGNVQLS